MLQRIWRKNAINFQYCFNKFPTLFHFKVGEICHNGYGEKMQ